MSIRRIETPDLIPYQPRNIFVGGLSDVSLVVDSLGYIKSGQDRRHRDPNRRNGHVPSRAESGIDVEYIKYEGNTFRSLPSSKPKGRVRIFHGWIELAIEQESLWFESIRIGIHGLKSAAVSALNPTRSSRRTSSCRMALKFPAGTLVCESQREKK